MQNANAQKKYCYKVALTQNYNKAFYFAVKHF